MLSRAVLNTLVKKNSPLNYGATAAYSTGGFHNERLPIGKREWVGYGVNGQPHYCDRTDYPMPAVRFMEITGDLIPLREKEKGDWKKMTIDEKKKLYRASFRQTLAEVEAPTGEWKSVVGWGMFFAAIGLWIFIIEKKFFYKPRPETFNEENREAQFRRMLDLKVGHISGLSSKWDFENDKWK